MKRALPSICLISSSLVEANLCLQPWRYLYEIARQLSHLGHPVTILTDGPDRSPAGLTMDGVALNRLPTLRNPWWRPNAILQQTIQSLHPDVVLWHLGLTSFLHNRPHLFSPRPIVAIFSSPLYDFRFLSGLGPRRLVAGQRISGCHLLGSLLPRSLLGRISSRWEMVCQLVVQTQTTKQQLVESGIWSGPVSVIPPGVDEEWQRSLNGRYGKLRAWLGFTPEDKVVVYFGSPAPLRGVDTLIRALRLASLDNQSLKLLILCRSHDSQLTEDRARLQKLVRKHDLRDRVTVEYGYLDKEDLVSHVAAADVVALPFALVPSDAPLSVIEASALTSRLVTTDVACLPELTHNRGFLARPADPTSLSEALLAALNDLQSNARPHLDPVESCRDWRQVGRDWSELLQTIV